MTAGANMTEPTVSDHPFAYYRWPVPLHPKWYRRVPTKSMWTLCWPTRCQAIDKDMTPEKFWGKVDEIFSRTESRAVSASTGTLSVTSTRCGSEVWRSEPGRRNFGSQAEMPDGPARGKCHRPK